MLIERVVSVTDTKVSFTGFVEGRAMQVNARMKSADAAQKMAKVLNENVGKKPGEIAEFVWHRRQDCVV